MIKADGCVAIHADGGAYKPLNWMNAPNLFRESGEGSELTWIVTNDKSEKLTIQLHEVLSDSSHEMGSDPGLEKDGVEAHLQELLAANVEQISAGMVLVRREYPTNIGPVDLLCRDQNGQAVAVEIKRRGEIDGVEQLSRYLEFLNRDSNLKPVTGIYAAQEIKPQARVLAEDRGIECLILDYDELRGIESNELKLF
tara:strand:+ start:60 stop:650 length:591 start_codon:yes stop_codon:yes gene_type:complete